MRPRSNQLWRPSVSSLALFGATGWGFRSEEEAPPACLPRPTVRNRFGKVGGPQPKQFLV